ncbi:MAG: SymE family type I addiction module toxin [Chitinophagaceae bacterium]
MKNPRKIMVYSKSVQRRYDSCVIPDIRLNGKWLEALGFTIGKSIEIFAEQKKMVITICDDQPVTEEKSKRERKIWRGADF